MRFSICIPAFNESEHLPACIRAIRSSFLEAEIADYEIVVCDNNSTDTTSAIAAELGARVIFEPHNQIARARNAAAGIATGDWLIFIDADSFLSSALLLETLEATRNPEICGGGAAIEFDEPITIGLVRHGLGVWTLVSRMLNWAAGSYIFCLREAWTDSEGFGEEYYAGEEIEFSRRLKRWGKAHGKRFRILKNARILTSARKMRMFSERQLWITVVVMLFPGSLRKRERCGLWYERPV